MPNYLTGYLKATIVILSAGLSGCDLANGATESGVYQKYTNGPFREPTIVMSPGWRMDDHGKEALIFGSSQCPDANGNTTSEGGCVLIENHSETVAVIVVDATKQFRRQETWTIEHKKDRTIVMRPDNSYVMPWVK
ncbi:hypothetical protein VBJ26_19860 [Enterobacter hormaechei]|jgi:hypothetical protein|nr:MULTISPECIES: hypothetical protein [Enterobacteriaceae]AIX52486.1 hypothetical protein PSNIH1_19870 [Pantoea sp. PSNIH1]AIX76474.1 hypothetical protein PSNIH2_22390 [Pantoea sp. PSNIH2]EFP8475248.1 hypothetical protein [Shigella boydii]EFV0703957.1 hypothetical protein [Salmonella enterica]EHG4428970.1 hypothetical protein [Salmonella enterica subsp. enterica serovar Virchow]EHM7840537.1 hypothetical protein [Salmonella enterica subsp. enterica serovar Senftenberg]EIT0808901.1 hypothetica